MKRYIRTKGGKIYDIKELRYVFNKFYFPTKEDYERAIQGTIIKQAATVEGLIEDNDLTDLGYWKDIAYKDEADIEITELYTKQGNNYILVAKKVNGEWRVL